MAKTPTRSNTDESQAIINNLEVPVNRLLEELPSSVLDYEESNNLRSY